MALSTQPKLNTNGILRLICGAVSLTVTTDAGDVKISGLGKRLNAPVRVQSRGRHRGSGYGARRYPTVTFSEQVFSLTGAAAPGSVRDFVTFTAAYSANVSTSPTGQPPTIDVEYTAQDNSGGVSDVVRMNLVDFNSYDFAEGAEVSMLPFTGEILGTVLINGVEMHREIAAGGT